jgi:hypothetical protein
VSKGTSPTLDLIFQQVCAIYEGIKVLVSILERGVKMSEPLVVTTKGNLGQTEGSSPVRISQAVAQEIDSIATKRQVKVGVLINEILERYIVNQFLAKRRNGTAFLLSLAGMFNSGVSSASENVRAIVTDFILNQR